MSAGVQIQIRDLGTLAQVERKLQALAKPDMRALMQGIGAELETQTRRRIEEEKASPAGTPWPGWSDEYAASKHGTKSHQPHKSEKFKAQNHSLLDLSGALIDSIGFNVLAGAVEWGSNKVYAAAHNYGFESIPQREFLGISDENARDIEDIVVSFLEESLR